MEKTASLTWCFQCQDAVSTHFTAPVRHPIHVLLQQLLPRWIPQLTDLVLEYRGGTPANTRCQQGFGLEVIGQGCERPTDLRDASSIAERRVGPAAAANGEASWKLLTIVNPPPSSESRVFWTEARKKDSETHSGKGKISTDAAAADSESSDVGSESSDVGSESSDEATIPFGEKAFIASAEAQLGYKLELDASAPPQMDEILVGRFIAFLHAVGGDQEDGRPFEIQ